MMLIKVGSSTSSVSESNSEFCAPETSGTYTSTQAGGWAPLLPVGGSGSFPPDNILRSHFPE